LIEWYVPSATILETLLSDNQSITYSSECAFDANRYGTEKSVTKSGEVFLFLVKDSAVRRLNSKGEHVVYKSFEPLLVRGLHVTKSDEIVVGLREKGALFPVTVP
jgi:hypothetical protein